MNDVLLSQWLEDVFLPPFLKNTLCSGGNHCRPIFSLQHGISYSRGAYSRTILERNWCYPRKRMKELSNNFRTRKDTGERRKQLSNMFLPKRIMIDVSYWTNTKRFPRNSRFGETFKNHLESLSCSKRIV